MGGVGIIDYSRIGVPRYGEDFKGIGDALFEAMKFRAEQDKAAESSRHNRALEEYNMRLANQGERRLNASEDREAKRFTNEQNDRSIKAASSAASALGHGQDGLFNALIAGNGIKDSVSNPAGAPPEAPKPPLMPPALGGEPDFVGPIDSPEHAAALARQEAINNPPPGPTTDDREGARGDLAAVGAREQVASQEASVRRYQQELRADREAQDKYKQDQTAYQQAEAEFPRRQREYGEQQVHTLTLPNGQAVQLNEGRERYAARTKDAADLRDAVMPSLQAQMAQARSLPGESGAVAASEVQRRIDLLQQHAAAVMGGAQDAAAAYKAYESDVRDGAHEARIQSEGAAGRQNKVDVAHIMANRPSASIGAERLGYQMEADRSRFLRQDATRFQADNLAKDIGEQARSSAQLVGKLGSGEPGTVRLGLLELWRIAQHDTRMSDKDAVLASQNDQSVLAKIQDWANKGATGLPGDLNLAAAQDTAARLRGYFVAKSEQLSSKWQSEFVKSGQYDPREADVLGSQILPDYKRQFPDQAPPAGRPTRPAVGGGGSVRAAGSAVPRDDNGDPDLKALRSLLGP